MSNWQSLTPMGIGGLGGVSQGGAGGGGYQTPAGFRNALDAARSGIPKTPSAQYPDGYLGTIVNRRDDRILAAVKNKLGDRSYQRGVHVGSKINPSDYAWPEWFNPQTSLELQAQGKKFSPTGAPAERLAHMGKVPFTTPGELGRIAQQYDLAPDLAHPENDSARIASLSRFRPPWS